MMMNTAELRDRAEALLAVLKAGSTDAPDPDAVDAIFADATTLAENALALLNGFQNGPITHLPFVGKNGQTGLRNVHEDGRVEYIYFNPSNYDADGGRDGAEGCNVFVYQGTEGDPAQDGPLHFYYIFDPEDWEEPEGVNETPTPLEPEDRS